MKPKMELPTSNLNKNELANFDHAIQREWLVTNGLGGYAASTALGINTRKYHGLLVASLHPPVDRTVCLAKLDEEICVGDENFNLGANEFIGVIHPSGFRFLKEFIVSGFPTYIYEAGKIEVRKTTFMPHERNASVTIYHVRNSGMLDSTIRIYPLMSCRHFHSVVDRKANQLCFTQISKAREVELVFSQPKATLISRAVTGTFSCNSNWIQKLRYCEEEARGESSLDDCFQPGFFEFHLPHEHESKFAVATAVSESDGEEIAILNEIGNSITEIESLLARELNRKSTLLTRFYVTHKDVTATDWLSWILLAADSFITKKKR